jgi:hypothetical protein
MDPDSESGSTDLIESGSGSETLLQRILEGTWPPRSNPVSNSPFLAEMTRTKPKRFGFVPEFVLLKTDSVGLLPHRCSTGT